MSRTLRRAGRAAPRWAAVLLVYFGCYGLLFPPSVMPQVWGQDGRSDAEHAARVQRATPRALAALDVLQDIAAGVPRAGFSVGAAAEALPDDPRAVALWVARSIRPVPYAGALRGPAAVLTARSGNSLDRSRLLAALLKAKGVEATLAHARLDEATAVAVVNARRRWTPDPPGGSAEPTDTAPDLRSVAEQLGFTEQRIKAERHTATIKAMQARDRADRRVAWQADHLIKLAGFDEDARGDEAAATEHDAAAAAARDIYWVRIDRGDEAIDLRLEPDAVWGDTGPPAPAAGLDPAELPEALEHRLTVRVIAERWHDGTLHEGEALAYTAAASAVHAQPLRLQILPIDQPVEPQEGETRNDALRRVATQTRQWMPLLGIGGESVQQFSIWSDGTINPKPSPLAAGKKVGSAIQGLRGVGVADEAESQLTAIWLEFEVARPGRPTTVVRRSVMDVLGPSRRESGGVPDVFEPDATTVLRRGVALQGETQVLPLAGRLSPKFVQAEVLDTIAAGRAAAMRMILAARAEDETGFGDAVNELNLPPVHLLHLAIGRHAGDLDDGEVFYDRLNLLASHFRPMLTDGADREPEVIVPPVFAIDIVENGVGVLVDQGEDPRLERVRQGVRDTHMEWAVLNEPGNPVAAPANASAQMAIDALAGREWSRVDLARPPPGIEPEQLARMRAAAEEGVIVVASDSGAPFDAWWRIDPSTGQALGIGENGWGVAVPEWLKVLILTTARTFSAREFGKILACAMLSALLGHVAGTLLADRTGHLTAIFVAFCVNVFVELICMMPTWLKNYRHVRRARKMRTPANHQSRENLREFMTEVGDMMKTHYDDLYR